MFFRELYKWIACMVLIVLLAPLCAGASDLPAVISKLPDEPLMELYSIVVEELNERGISHETIMEPTDPASIPVAGQMPAAVRRSAIDVSMEDALQTVYDIVGQQPYTETFVTYDPPVTPKPTFAPLIQLDGGDTVWISKTGRRYHTTPDCSGMNNPREVTLDQAIEKGLTPCRDCAYWLSEMGE